MNFTYLFAIFFLILLRFLSNCFERGLYINKFTSILGKSSEELSVINYALANNFTYICLYDVGLLLDQGKGGKLALFISKAKNRGLKEIGVSGGWKGHFDLFKAYQNKYGNLNNQKIDFFNFESEYWNEENPDQGFNNWLLDLDYMIISAGFSKKEIYLGQRGSIINITQLNIIKNKNIDRLLMSCYSSKQDEINIMNNCIEVYKNLKGEKNQNIFPLFSVESDFFGGNVNKTKVESNFIQSFNYNIGENSGITITGFMYFAYTYFSK